jgi:hypothetical protein
MSASGQALSANFQELSSPDQTSTRLEQIPSPQTAQLSPLALAIAKSKKKQQARLDGIPCQSITTKLGDKGLKTNDYLDCIVRSQIGVQGRRDVLVFDLTLARRCNGINFVARSGNCHFRAAPGPHRRPRLCLAYERNRRSFNSFSRKSDHNTNLPLRRHHCYSRLQVSIHEKYRTYSDPELCSIRPARKGIQC